MKPLLELKPWSSGLYYKSFTNVIYDRNDSGLYCKSFTNVIYDCNASGQYYKTMIMIVI